MGKKTLLKKVIALALALSILAPTNLMYAGAGEAGTDNPAEAEVTNVVTEGTNDPTTASTEAESEEATEGSSEEPTDESSEEVTEASSDEEDQELTEATTAEASEESDPTEPSTEEGQEPTEPGETEPSEEPTEPGEDTEPTEEPSEEETEPSEEETEPSEEPAEVELEPNTIVATMFANGDYDSEMAADELVKITVSGMLPVDAKIYAYPVEIELDIEGEEVLLAYDITIFDGNGSKWQPDETVEVIFSSPVLDEVEEVNVYHINEEDGEVTEVTMQTFAALNVDGHTTETIEVVEPGTFEVETVAENLAVDQVNQTVTFEADGFSTYVVTVGSNNKVSISINGVVTTLSGTSGSGTSSRPYARSGAFYVADGKVEVDISGNYYITGTPTATNGMIGVVSEGTGTSAQPQKYTISSLTQDTVVTMTIRSSGGTYYKLTLTFKNIRGYEGIQPATLTGTKSAVRTSTSETGGDYNVNVEIRSEPGKRFIHTEDIIEADVIISVDLSNSMDSSNYWSTAKSAMESMIDNLLAGENNTNTVSIAGYASMSDSKGAVETTNKAYYIYQQPTNSASAAKDSFNYSSAWSMRGCSSNSDYALTQGSRIKRGGTNSEAGFVAAAELVNIIKSTPNRDVDRQIVVIYISDGQPTKYYTYNGDTRSEAGNGSNYEAQGKNNTINFSKTLGDNVTVFTVGIGLQGSSNANAVQMMKESASTYVANGQQADYFYTDTTTSNLLERLSELGVKLAHTKIENDYHNEFTLVDPMSEYVTLKSDEDQILVQRQAPGQSWVAVPAGEYEVTIDRTGETDVINLWVKEYYGTQYTYRMVYDVEVKIEYGGWYIHKAGQTNNGIIPGSVEYGGPDGTASPLGTDGVALNGYTSVTSDLVTTEQEIKVPVGYREYMGFGTAVTVNKKWVGPAAASVEMTLQMKNQSGNWEDVSRPDNPMILTEAKKWTYTWTYLPEGEYQVVETPLDGYTREYESSISKDFSLIKRITPCSKLTLSANLDEFVLVNKGSDFLIWTPLKLTADQKVAIELWAQGEVPGFNSGTKPIYENGYGVYKIGSGGNIGTVTVVPGEVRFGDASNWSWIYFGKYQASEIHTWTNTYKLTELDIFKVDQDDMPLAGVRFSLTTGTFGEQDWTSVPSQEQDGNYTTDANGRIKLMLEAGSYCLTEVQGLDGYQGIDPIYFTVAADGSVTLTDANGVALTEESDVVRKLDAVEDNPETTDINEAAPITLKVINHAFFELPETGGIGTTMFTIIGIIVMAGAAVLMVTFLRKRRKAK